MVTSTWFNYSPLGLQKQNYLVYDYLHFYVVFLLQQLPILQLSLMYLSSLVQWWYVELRQ